MEFKPRNFMLLPTTECQASCGYCFGPNEGACMDSDVFYGALEFIDCIAPKDGRINITFHGGEPLLAGEKFYSFALPKLRERFGLRVNISMQSNLWNLSEEMIQLISEYNINIGTSLDGYKEMCDYQRGRGYFDKTMDGIRRLRDNGINVHCICTFTPAFANEAKKVFDFFTHENIAYSVHGAVKPLGYDENEFTISAADMEKVLLDTLEIYKEKISLNHVRTIDAMAKGCFGRKGSECTFTDCLGKFAAIAPDGKVYTCQRFCGHDKFSIADVRNFTKKPDVLESEILNSPAFVMLYEKQKSAEKACKDCAHISYCRGGCLYNMVAADSEKDPHCEAYKKVFDTVSRDMALEMGGIMTNQRKSENQPLLAMAGDSVHPYALRENLYKRKWALRLQSVLAPDFIRKNVLNKLYLHITFDCPLHCDHCYAEAGENKMPEMSAKDIADTVDDAQWYGFHSAVITGGEPLCHSDIDNVLYDLAGIDLKGMKLVLRTSLGFDIDEQRLKNVCEVFTEIVVSIDGDKITHDARRGEGTYDKTVSNIKHIKELGYIGKVSFCGTLNKKQREGFEGGAVYELARELGVKKVKLNPVLPLGRAEGVQQEEGFLCLDESDITSPFSIRYTCGLGQNLYIEPNGDAYPCYAWCGKDKLLGNIKDSLINIIDSKAFKELSCHHVDTNEKCKHCKVRYLCGGMCKAWVNNKTDIDSGDFDCSAKKAMYLRLAEMIEKRWL